MLHSNDDRGKADSLVGGLNETGKIMALIACPDCEEQFSDQAKACPNCGRPSKAAQLQSTNQLNQLSWVLAGVGVVVYFLGSAELGGAIFTVGLIISIWYLIKRPKGL
jgi:uncharacterized paraquat-inducible protein A